MRNIGGLLLVLGIAQATFQVWLLVSNGYWSGFTNADIMTELGLRTSYYTPYPALNQSLSWLLGREFSFTMIVLGALTSLWVPASRVYDAFQSARTMRKLGRDAAGRDPFADPLATHR